MTCVRRSIPWWLVRLFFAVCPLARYGVEWIQPEIAAAHPLDDGTAVGLYRSLAETASSIGGDGPSWSRLLGPSAADWDRLAPMVLGPYPVGVDLPALIRFGLPAAMPARLLSRLLFREERAKALFAGLVAHSFLDFGQPFTSAFGMLLGVLAHAVGWPFPRGGAQAITDAMGAYLRALGGDIVAGWQVQSLDELPSSRDGSIGYDAATGFAARGDAAAGRVPAQVGEISLWARRAQSGLCAERACAVAGAGLPRRGHRTSGRDAGGDCGCGRDDE